MHNHSDLLFYFSRGAYLISINLYLDVARAQILRLLPSSMWLARNWPQASTNFGRRSKEAASRLVPDIQFLPLSLSLQALRVKLIYFVRKMSPIFFNRDISELLDDHITFCLILILPLKGQFVPNINKFQMGPFIKDVINQGGGGGFAKR